MSQSEKPWSAGAMGAKTARACDGCVRRRARWYCAADDAFLCQACDSSVHSANPVARRHHRIRLKSSSSSSSSPAKPSALAAEDPQPPWLHGFRRKARTPRGKPAAQPAPMKVEPLVPELEDEHRLQQLYHDDEHLLYRVPIFDPVHAEFCSPPTSSRDEEAKPAAEAAQLTEPDLAASAAAVADDEVSFGGFHPSAVDLAEFAANMESLLGQGLDDEGKFCIDGLGLTDATMEEEDGVSAGDSKGRVKSEFDFAMGGSAACDMDVEIDLSRETLELNFDCASPPAMGDEAEEHKMADAAAAGTEEYGAEAAAGGKKQMILRLDYEAVIEAWSCKGCLPWTDGERPQFDPGDCWADFTGMWGGGEIQGFYGGEAAAAAMGPAGDGGREARVSRYREKRRTRLFSKKIRYEVRKLNAEKRPRMKGRFVKRAAVYQAAVPPPGSFPLLRS